jgi:organic radical activating enzyme
VTAALVVSEIFGPTLQGEGPSAGRRAGFVRLGRCSLDCGWCDTPYSWDWKRYDPSVELHEMTVDAVAARVLQMDVPVVVVTGGEPLLQQRGLTELLSRLPDLRVEVETNGIHAPEPDLAARVDRFNVSPKLANAGIERSRRYRPDVLRGFEAAGHASFKFVAAGAGDLDEIAAMVDECALSDVWVMPEGVDAATIIRRMQQLADGVLSRGWHLSPRLHILLWGDERGR